MNSRSQGDLHFHRHDLLAELTDCRQSPTCPSREGFFGLSSEGIFQAALEKVMSLQDLIIFSHDLSCSFHLYSSLGRSRIGLYMFRLNQLAARLFVTRTH